MKKIAALLLIITFSGFSALANNQVTVTAVEINTPLPTGLETAANNQKPNNSLFAMLMGLDDVKPFLDATTDIHSKLINANIAAGPHFAREGMVSIDCNKSSSFSAVNLTGWCAFIATKSFGWYADIDLEFVVTGYITKKELLAKKYATKKQIKKGRFFIFK